MRVLKELTRGWEDIRQRSLIAGGDWKSLPALSELSHPAIQVCQDFDTNPASPKYERHKEATAGCRVPRCGGKRPEPDQGGVQP